MLTQAHLKDIRTQLLALTKRLNDLEISEGIVATNTDNAIAANAANISSNTTNISSSLALINTNIASIDDLELKFDNVVTLLNPSGGLTATRTVIIFDSDNNSTNTVTLPDLTDTEVGHTITLKSGIITGSSEVEVTVTNINNAGPITYDSLSSSSNTLIWSGNNWTSIGFTNDSSTFIRNAIGSFCRLNSWYRANVSGTYAEMKRPADNESGNVFETYSVPFDCVITRAQLNRDTDVTTAVDFEAELRLSGGGGLIQFNFSMGSGVQSSSDSVDIGYKFSEGRRIVTGKQSLLP